MGHPLDEGERRLALFRRGLLEDVEVAAAGRRAAALLRRQHGDAEVEGGVVLDDRQVAGGMPHDGGLALEEVLPQRTPLDRALGHHLVPGAEVLPEFQGLDGRGRVEIGFVAGAVHQDLVVLHGQRAEHPVRVTGGRDHDSPLRSVGLGQFLARGHQLVPGRGRLFGIEPGVAERVLVVVHDDGRALERNAPGLAAGAAVLHQRRVERIEPGPIFGRCDDVVEGDDRVLLDEFVDVDREHHRQLRRLAALQRRQRLDPRVVVIAGIDRVDLDVRVFLHEVGDDAVDHLGQRAADRDRVIHGQLGGRLRGRGGQAETCGQQDPGYPLFDYRKHF